MAETAGSVEQEILLYFQSKGLTRAQAAGIVGKRHVQALAVLA